MPKKYGKPDFSELSAIVSGGALSKARDFIPNFMKETDDILNDPELREKMQMAISIQHTEGEALGDENENETE
jgi:hypothetical protein